MSIIKICPTREKLFFFKLFVFIRLFENKTWREKKRKDLFSVLSRNLLKNLTIFCPFVGWPNSICVFWRLQLSLRCVKPFSVLSYDDVSLSTSTFACLSQLFVWVTYSLVLLFSHCVSHSLILVYSHCHSVFVFLTMSSSHNITPSLYLCHLQTTTFSHTFYISHSHSRSDTHPPRHALTLSLSPELLQAVYSF